MKYKQTYLDTVKEFINLGSDNESTNHYLKRTLKQFDEEFEKFVQEEINNHNNIQSAGRVQCTEFWILDENDTYCGRISLRHRLNEFLTHYGGHIGYDIRPSKRGNNYATLALGLCLKEAKKIGLDEVLITCDDDNIASIKIIERNGGVFQNTIKQDSGIMTKRYTIKVS